MLYRSLPDLTQPTDADLDTAAAAAEADVERGDRNRVNKHPLRHPGRSALARRAGTQ